MMLKKRARTIDDSEGEASEPAQSNQQSLQESAGEDPEDIQAQIDAMQRQIEAVQQEAKQLNVRKREQKAESKVEAKASKPAAGGKKTQKSELSEEQQLQIANELVNKMADAYQNDIEQNEAGKPALAKMLLLSDVCHDLRKLAIQEKFMDKNGLSMIGLWLKRLPDGTFPNATLCKELLQLVSSLNIEADNLEASKPLINVMREYASGCTGKLDLQTLAKQTMDKWDRTLQKITTIYNKERMEDNLDQYLRFKDRQANQVAPEKQKQDRLALIQKTQEGIVMPTKNNFDFVEHPKMMNDFTQPAHKTKETSNKIKLKKLTDGLKRASKATYQNKRMATVKMDY